MKNIFLSEIKQDQQMWKFSYDSETGAWDLFPVKQPGLYQGVSLDIFDAKKMALELVRIYDLNAPQGKGQALSPTLPYPQRITSFS